MEDDSCIDADADRVNMCRNSPEYYREVNETCQFGVLFC